MNKADADEHYARGYRDAQDEIKANLATALRLHAVSMGEDNEEILSDAMVREIFATVFDVKATDDEFGPAPTGAGVRARLNI